MELTREAEEKDGLPKGPSRTPTLCYVFTREGERMGTLALQGRAKLMELSLVTHVPLGPIGCAWAGHFSWQK